MPMPRYINVRMINALDPCAISKLLSTGRCSYRYPFQVAFLMFTFSSGLMEVEKKIVPCVTFLVLRTAG